LDLNFPELETVLSAVDFMTGIAFFKSNTRVYGEKKEEANG
jgi:hypothetical protein